ncbi:methyltransferase domain-containing protein [Candidatus Woesearchaeota archaeon]|nr:methyltransferase domain-containing protein [Candidatus Woesearchaeota archaeon]
MELKELLKSKLTKEEIKLLPKSFDIVGSIAVFSDFPRELKKKEKLISNALLKEHKNIRTVAKKIEFYKGKYRTPKISIISGEKTKETMHKENDVLAKLNIETCYFSPRLANERLRIAKLVRPKESILVMFSGVAIYNLVISKNSNAKEIYGIELNKKAHKYALENLRLNKIENIKLIRGDVKKIIPKLKKKFDRIIMPLPKNAEDYLDYALKVSKKDTIIHFYDFEHENEIKNSEEKIKNHLKKYKILKIVKCGQYAPRKYRICVDFKIL